MQNQEPDNRGETVRNTDDFVMLPSKAQIKKQENHGGPAVSPVHPEVAMAPPPARSDSLIYKILFKMAALMGKKDIISIPLEKVSLKTTLYTLAAGIVGLLAALVAFYLLANAINFIMDYMMTRVDAKGMPVTVRGGFKGVMNLIITIVLLIIALFSLSVCVASFMSKFTSRIGEKFEKNLLLTIILNFLLITLSFYFLYGALMFSQGPNTLADIFSKLTSVWFGSENGKYISWYIIGSYGLSIWLLLNFQIDEMIKLKSNKQ